MSTQYCCMISWPSTFVTTSSCRTVTGWLVGEVYVATEEYPLQLDSVTWGWIHLVVGVLAMVVGFGLFAARAWARTSGVVIAVVSALATFVWLPQFPLWGFAILAVNLLVIWALTVHGGDLIDET